MFSDVFLPIQELAARDGRLDLGATDVDVFRLSMRFSVEPGNLIMSVVGAERVADPPQRRQARGSQDLGDCDSEAEAGAPGSSGSDVQELVSDVDSEVGKILDDEHESSNASEQSDGERVAPRHDEADVPDIVVPRAPRGSYVVMSNGYFVLVNNPRFADAKIILQNKWAAPQLLGAVNGCSQKSKTLLIAPHDGPIPAAATPTITNIVLRAWMIWRSNFRPFLDAKTARRRWHQSEIDLLRADIIALEAPGGGTGSEVADARIRCWCPAALQPGAA